MLAFGEVELLEVLTGCGMHPVLMHGERTQLNQLWAQRRPGVVRWSDLGVDWLPVEVIRPSAVIAPLPRLATAVTPLETPVCSSVFSR